MPLTSVQDVVTASGIGASEIAGVVGISPWSTPWQIYARKYNLVEPEPQSEEMFWGKTLEPVIAGVFSRKMDLPIEWCDQRIYSKQRAWQYSSPDAFVLREPRELLECKTAGLHRAGEWDRDTSNEDGVPDYYVVQVQWQMSTLDLNACYIAVLIAGNDFRIYRIARDPVLEEFLLEEGDIFWRKYILAHVEPPIDGSERARRYLRQRFPREQEKLRAATADEIEQLDEYAQLRHLLHQGEERKKELENQITQGIADHEGIAWARGKFTWKRIKDRSLTNWEELARSQLLRYNQPEQAEFIARHTRIEPGYRRIYFREEAAQ